MTVETHGMQFVVDASGVAKGFHDYESAVEGIFKSLDQFEKKVASTMSAIERAANNRAALAGFKKNLDQFANIKVDTAAAGKLSTLSAAMSGFRAPTEVQSANTRKFFNSLSNLPDLSKAYASIKNLDQLKSAMASFKAPPLTQANNLTKFAQAIEKAAPAFRSLGRIAGVSGVANELATISIAMGKMKVPSASEISRIGNLGLALQHLGRANTGNTGEMLHSLAGISNFKAPTQTNINNLVKFANALHEIKPIPNAPLIAEQMMLIANAASSASRSMAGFRGNLGGFNPAYGRFNEGTRSAKVEMMGLQNAFSGTFQVGSVLRSMLGSLTVAELGREFFKATQTMNQFEAGMQVIGTNPVMTGQAWERVRADANHFGADLNVMSESFSKFALAAHANGVSLQESFKIFEGFQTVMTATHMGTEQQQSVGLAIREMMDQGYVSTSRLTRQLGLVLPGATKTLMQAWKDAGQKDNFWDALKKKEVDSTWALDVLTKYYKKEFGPAVKQALESPIQQWNILKNNITSTMIEISNAGAKKAFANLIAQISGYMDPSKTQTFAQTIGGALTKAINKLGEAVKFLHDHWNTLVVPMAHVLKLMAEWEMLMSVFQIGKWMISPITTLFGVLGTLGKQLSSTITLFKALKTAEIEAGAASYAGGLGSRAKSIVKQAPTSAITKSGEALGSADLAARMTPKFQTLFNLIQRAKGLLADFAESGVGQFVSKFSSGIGTVARLFGELAIAFEVTWAVGTKAAEDNGIKMQHSSYTTTQIIRGAWLYLTDAIRSAWNTTTNFVGAKWTSLKPYLIAGAKGAVNGILEAFTFMGFSIYTIMATVLNTMEGVWKAAGAGLSKLASAGHKVTQGDLKGAIADAAGLGTAAGDAFKGAFAGQMGYGAFKKNLGINIAHLNDIGVGMENTLGARAAAEDAKNAPKAGPPRPKPLAGDAPDQKNPRYQGTEGKEHKPKKGPDPYTAINKSENAIDDLMKSLNAGDPMAKLYSDFTKTITKESKDLLTAPGHKAWLAQINADGKTADQLAEAQTTALIHQLETGQGINKKNLADLEKRYGETIPGIVKLLKAQLDDLHEHEIESLKKTIDQENKEIMKARKMIGDFDPQTKTDLDFTGKMEPLAEKFMNPDQYKGFYRGLTDGTLKAGTAFDDLKARMIAAIQPGNAMHANFLKLGISGERLTAILEAMGFAYRDESKAAADKLVFGKTLIDQGNEDLKLARLTSDQQQIMKSLQQAINDAKRDGAVVTDALVSKIKDELVAQQALGRQLARNDEFFQNNGVRDYINSLQGVGAAVNDLDKNFLQSLNDQLVSLGETGKFSFNKIFDTIRSGMIKMAADGITKSFTKGIFGEDALNNGQPSFFGSTVGKMMGGYGPDQQDKYGQNGSAAQQALLKGAGYDPVTHQFTGLGGGLGAGGMRGQTIMTPLYVQDVGASGIGGVGAGGVGGLGKSLFPVGADGVDPLAPLAGGDGGGGGGIGGIGGGSPAAKAGATVANSFKTNMAQMIPMVGMMFAGAFKSPIAQIGVMFLTMMLEKMMMSSAASAGGGAGGGGGGGGIMGAIMGLFSHGGAPVPGALEGGITGSFVNNYRVNPSAFVNAPHYSEGTPNTSGGMPAILHENEAVIPLSRGRNVPVKLTNVPSGANTRPIQVNFNVTSPDADSFQQSRQQIMTQLHGAMTRSFARNS